MEVVMFRHFFSRFLIITLGLTSSSFSAYDSPNIIGGVVVGADDPDAVSTVAILTRGPDGVSLCSASLLAPDILITAAHCVTETFGESTSSQNLRVVFGKNLNTDTVIVRRVTGSKAHPSWKGLGSRGKDQGDIAVVRFKDGLPDGYRPAKILDPNVNLKRGSKTLLMGFGVDRLNESGGSGAGVLRKVDAKIDQPDFARTEVLLDQRNGKGACYGDSGGPAFVRSTEGETLLWGVTNRGNPENERDCRHGSIYTRITSYTTFINATVKELREHVH